MGHIHIDRDILLLAVLLIIGLAAGYSLLSGSFSGQDASVTGPTVGMLVDEAYQRADSRFYAEGPSGDFKISRYYWARDKSGVSPDSTPVKEADVLNALIRFDGNYSDSLRVFAFKTYEVEGNTQPMVIYGTAVFLSKDPLIERFRSGGDFDVGYDPHPMGYQEMEGCRVLATSESMTSLGTPLYLYDFECDLIYDD